ncbi:hypothetical protein A2837_02700 [Candidatus Kaiserbacteria bacterium RIFCSPHIGHO2_01_FULL_46_22]|uniref:Transglutaminase n=1 Tax=Candidatus Kaiserbacteria bacterium RIFCSPHIGHO2_01_FULL_46_22 TaxID=1798475 RepID=A0A1F6BXK7_9BACT|nr:MAG: hypothetical protein A2837_02700 [Candidatus Kaiserbacteria bacterium RIFCSPHIGHO2_01_FULL_46_22]
MATGKKTEMLVGHYVYCKTHPSDCKPHKEVRVVALNNYTWGLITSVNAEVNRTIQSMTDQDQYGVEEKWVYPVSGYGDCEDYVLVKRQKLAALGLPISALLITKAVSNGEGHAILTIRTNKGDLILDSLTYKVWAWHKSPYLILARQSPFHAGKWERVRDLRKEEAFTAVSNNR